VTSRLELLTEERGPHKLKPFCSCFVARRLDVANFYS
jgi:hypothetical protein